MLDNEQIARRLGEIRTLMELAGEPFYKFMAYERAASAIENAGPVNELLAAGELKKLPGVGKSIAATIAELCERGDCTILEELSARFPRTIFELLGVSGIGIKTAAMLFEQFAIGSVADLERAVESGVLSGAPRFGPKTLENIRRGILAYKGRQHRTPLGRALRVAKDVAAFLQTGPALDRVTYAGSWRSSKATVGDIDIVCTSDSAAAVIDHFVRWDRGRAVLSEGPTKGSIWLDDGLQIDLRVLPDNVYGNLLQHFTGSREHNIQVREHAARKNLRVSENGILNLENGEVFTSRDEQGVYAALGMQYVPPELRSGIGEVDLALRNELPELLEASDVRGDFHMHTTWSDGRQTLEEMIAAVAARGYEYHAITDHSPSRGIIGCSADELRTQREAIRALGDKYGVRTLWGSEGDILPDGSMDFPDDVLQGMDVVIASVHSSFRQSREEMTNRLITACENPYVTIIGHPTGRKVDGFEGYEYDYDAVFAAAARTGTALEIDGQPKRFDLPANLARRAKSLGVTLTVDSDAHDAGQLGNIDLAIVQARRAGLTRDDVLNARPLEGVLEFVRAKRERLKR